MARVVRRAPSPVVTRSDGRVGPEGMRPERSGLAGSIANAFRWPERGEQCEQLTTRASPGLVENVGEVAHLAFPELLVEIESTAALA